ncbi:TPM domain-containing protein [Pusillimonas sp. ANT_WB101]|uniref:TPM domain-containing protein n=1 Tax=Pusillimonas sp. ANT_WB101 TaxID=2597356 RepID=UPI0011EC34BA|nr:TPM domain-containing protein [Pusillimonas sp. ANT_WB101]KAA0889599.1 hypothetical protein FQ179_20930 [Pusillimonas sp. ANT_WB101]
MSSRRDNWKKLTGWSSLAGQWLRRKHFNAAMLDRLAERIRQSEISHTGELVVAIEAVSPSHEADSEQRALEVFGKLHVWDTPLNTGVLLYLALDRQYMQIIADRGVKASDAQWAAVCAGLQQCFVQQRYEAGLFAAIDTIEIILKSACPPVPEGGRNTDDLPNTPVLL